MHHTMIRAGLIAALLIPFPADAQSVAAEATPELGVDLSAFDRSVRPQDDFYRFVNGGWLARTEIPADRSNYGTFTELDERAEAALRLIVEEAAADRSAPSTDRSRIGALYRSFMDSTRIESLGIAPVRGQLDSLAALASHEKLSFEFARLARAGVQRPFSLNVSQDARDATRYTVYLSQSGLGLPDRDYYFREGFEFARTRGEYVDYIATLLALAGTPRPQTAANRVMALETRLAESSWTRVQNRDRNATYNRMTVAELERLAPEFDWSGYLAAAGADVDEVVVRQPSFFSALDSILATTSVDALRNYLTFKTLDAAAPYLSSEFARARFDFRGRVLAGTERDRERWKRGISVVSGAVGDALGRLYVERHFRPEAKARMEELVANLMEAFRRGIDALEWMSPETRAEAHAKLASFSTKIGYPDEWEDYSALEIREGDLLGNLRRVSEFEYRDRIERLGQPVDREEWFMNPFTVNAYYSSTMNEIVFPAAILQPPFFNVAADDAVNYGAIGGVIGHEISHGFDDQGRKSDGQGNLRDWWTEADATAFEERATRLGAQYDAFSPLEGMNVNGRLTMGENIGDLSGLTVAYDAWRISLEGREPPVIEGFTDNQRFFLGWAQIWRRLYRDAELRNRLLTDSHSPSEYRTNGVLRNMDAFIRAFDVQPGDGMWLPEDERVEIW
ncbi:MAG TPA: M13 family metallopeptidase [Longimicrobiales bacterium]|nr:M13 family metallopeptidase [Longimicrobiales bacterium]